MEEQNYFATLGEYAENEDGGGQPPSPTRQDPSAQRRSGILHAQMAAGYLPWTDTFDLDEFYQYPIDQSALKKTAHGWTLNKLKRTLIRKHKPSHQK